MEEIKFEKCAAGPQALSRGMKRAALNPALKRCSTRNLLASLILKLGPKNQLADAPAAGKCRDPSFGAVRKRTTPPSQDDNLVWTRRRSGGLTRS